MEKFDGILISESAFTAKPKILRDTEEVTIIETILQEAEAPNRNGRIYSKSSLLGAIQSPRIQEQLKMKTLVGESGHPLSDDIKRQTYIDQTRISHIITEMHFEGNLLKGVVESAKTHCGEDFRGLCRQGMQMAFSMRGLGGVARKEGTFDRIDGKLYIITYDWVLFPSHNNAYMTNILKEHSEYNDMTANQILTESTILDVKFNEVARFITQQSNNVKEMAEYMKMSTRNAVIDPYNKTLDLKENGDILKIKLESTMEKELDNFLRNIKF